jgi:chromosome segregation ATPase
MKINLFGSGKSEKKNKPLKSSAASSQIADLEKQLNGWTDNLKQTEQRLKKFTDKANEFNNDTSGNKEKTKVAKLDIEPVRPHGPIRELSLDSGDSFSDEIQREGEDIEVVKTVEAKPDAQNAAAAAKVEKPGALSDSFKDLFADDEVDENPLANLIKSLPDVSTNELEDDLKEIKDIIKDWQKK